MTSHVLCIHQSRFYFFFSSLRFINKRRERRRKKKEVKEIKEATIKVKTKIAIKTKRLLNSRRRNVCILINIALFVCLSEKKIFIIMTNVLNYLCVIWSQLKFSSSRFNHHLRRFKINIRIYDTHIYVFNIIK